MNLICVSLLGRSLFVYFPSEIAHVFLVPASVKFSVLATNALHEICMCTPSIGDGTLYFRTSDKLVAVGSK